MGNKNIFNLNSLFPFKLQLIGCEVTETEPKAGRSEEPGASVHILEPLTQQHSRNTSKQSHSDRVSKVK